MKRLLLGLVCCSFLFFYSCQDEQVLTDEPGDGQASLLSKNELPVQDAEKILTDFIGKSNFVSPKTRSNGVSIKGFSKKYSSNVQTRGTATEPVAFYSFDLESNNKEGYAIVCADKRFPQVVAYSTNGSLKDVENSGNVFLANYVANLPDAVALLIENRMDFPDLAHKYTGGFPYEDVPNVAHTWETDSTTERVVFLKESITWDQGDSYNMYIPFRPSGVERGLVGCTNIACANIMAYYRYPATYDWASMLEYRVVIPGYQPDAVVEKAAQLCKDLFDANHSVVNENSTTTALSNVVPGLRSFGYESSNTMQFSLDSIKASLEQFYPVYMRGQDPQSAVGHAFVVRGYWEIQPKDSTSNLDHAVSLGINWGWMGGFGDGFYLVQYGPFNLSYIGLHPLILGDYGPEYSNKNYIDVIRLITRIRPKAN